MRSTFGCAHHQWPLIKYPLLTYIPMHNRSKSEWTAKVDAELSKVEARRTTKTNGINEELAKSRGRMSQFVTKLCD